MSKRIPHDLSNMALISMYYQSDHLRLLEEYLVFDFNSILVAMGGSLGLFLGFSFSNVQQDYVQILWTSPEDCLRGGFISNMINLKLSCSAKIFGFLDHHLYKL